MKSQGHVSGHQGSHNHNTRDEVQFRVFSSFIVPEIPEHILRCLPSAGHWFFSFNTCNGNWSDAGLVEKTVSSSITLLPYSFRQDTYVTFCH